MTDSQGASGAISFGLDRSQFVALFFSQESPRSPFCDPTVIDDGLNLLRTVPLQLQALTAMALPLLTFDVDGVRKPLVSSLFWSGLVDGYSDSCEPWELVYENGGFLIENELLSEQAGLAAWTKDMGLAEAEADLVADLYRRRLATMTDEVLLTDADVNQLRQLARRDGFQVCAKALAEIGIVVGLKAD